MKIEDGEVVYMDPDNDDEINEPACCVEDCRGRTTLYLVVITQDDEDYFGDVVCYGCFVEHILGMSASETEDILESIGGLVDQVN